LVLIILPQQNSPVEEDPIPVLFFLFVFYISVGAGFMQYANQLAYLRAGRGIVFDVRPHSVACA
jgi:hypothetical protein